MGESRLQTITIGQATAIVTALVAVFGLLWTVYVYFVSQPSTSDLSISSLADIGRLKAAHGIDPLFDEEYQAAIYPEGVRAAFIVVHNRAGKAPVTLTDIDLEIERVSGRNPRLSKWLIDATERSPAGLGKADVFKLTLAGERVESAYWKKKRLKGENFLEVADGSDDFRFDVMPTEPSSELVFNIRTVETGLYRVRFRFTYFVEGRSSTKLSEDIMIYMEE